MSHLSTTQKRAVVVIVAILSVLTALKFVFADVSGSLAINDTLSSFYIGNFKPKFQVTHLDGTKHAVFVEPNTDIQGADAFTYVAGMNPYTMYANISIPVIAHECVHSSYYHYNWKIDLSSGEGNETLAYDVERCVAETLAGLQKKPLFIANTATTTAATTSTM